MMEQAVSSAEIGMGRILDSKVPKGYLPFLEAREFAKALNFTTRKEWRQYVKGDLTDKPQKPASIPAHPDGVYKLRGWQGWKFWLGTSDIGLYRQ